MKRFRACSALSMLVSLLALSASPWAAAQSDRGRTPADLSARLADLQKNPKLAEAVLKTGQKVAAVCANCHGDGGNSTRPDVPNLAGQNSAYLIEQMRRFADGSRRNEFMEGMIKAMSIDEKIGMAMFYSAQAVTTRPVANAALVAQGEAYYQKVCFRCHGTDGHGNDKIARIAGQQTGYLATTLKRYRAGSGERIEPAMADSTRALTDVNIDAIVAFVASMK
jgi:cytochrome c553